MLIMPYTSATRTVSTIDDVGSTGASPPLFDSGFPECAFDRRGENLRGFVRTRSMLWGAIVRCQRHAGVSVCQYMSNDFVGMRVSCCIPGHLLIIGQARSRWPEKIELSSL